MQNRVVSSRTTKRINRDIMHKLIIEPTQKTPKVIFDPEKMIFEISGESRPYDVPEFYLPLLDWLDAYSKYLAQDNNPSSSIDFNFTLEYFNSLSAKYILDFCKKLNRLRTEGNNINAKWYYEEEDDYMLESGQEMSKISELPLEFVEIKQ